MLATANHDSRRRDITQHSSDKRINQRKYHHACHMIDQIDASWYDDDDDGDDGYDDWCYSGDEHEEEEEDERRQRDRAYSLPNLSEWALEVIHIDTYVIHHMAAVYTYDCWCYRQLWVVIWPFDHRPILVRVFYRKHTNIPFHHCHHHTVLMSSTLGVRIVTKKIVSKTCDIISSIINMRRIKNARKVALRVVHLVKHAALLLAHYSLRRSLTYASIITHPRSLGAPLRRWCMMW